MRYYGGIDLSARSSQICLIDEQLNRVLEKKVPNQLSRVVELLSPYQPDLEIVVESTFNWDWLVDGLQDTGFKVQLAHTLGLALITQAKVKTDRRDALALAKLLKAGLIPSAYIYPKATRPLRDLARRRLDLVRRRTGEYGYLGNLLLRHGLLEIKSEAIKYASEADLNAWFEHPVTRLQGHQQR